MVTATEQECEECGRTYWQGCLVSEYGYLCDDCLPYKQSEFKTQFEQHEYIEQQLVKQFPNWEVDTFHSDNIFIIQPKTGKKLKRLAEIDHDGVIKIMSG